jgi:Domain of unknown function (DUF4129)
LRIETRRSSHHVLIGSVLLAVLVVAAAGISGTIHFAGPRWLPDWKFAPGIQRSHTKTTAGPTKLPPQTTKPAHSSSYFPLGAVLLWIVAAIAAFLVARLLWRLWTGRRSRSTPGQHSLAMGTTSVIPVQPEPDPPALRTGIELALEALDEQRDPTDAVVRAWLGMQDAAEESGIARKPTETPTEFTSRIMSQSLADDRAVRTLLRLYLRTRFSDHPVTSDDVAVVRAALQELIRTWPAPKSIVGTTRR